MKNSIAIALLFNLLLGGTACLQAAPTSPPVAEPVVVPLWPGGSIESRGLHEAEEIKDYGGPGHHDRSVRNITEPDLEIFHAAKPNGCGVVIIPGGGYYAETMDMEGRDVARWFNSIGVNAFVLKYRLPNTTSHRFGPEVPLRDAQRALRLVRSHAEEWGVQSDRIGVLGFSAGGHLASTLGTHFDGGDTSATNLVDRASCRPDFLVLGYPVISMGATITHGGSRNELLGPKPSADLIERFSNELHVTTNTPPVFIFCANDDHAVNVDNSLCFYNAARAAGVPAELHIFEQGGHGFGMKPNNRAGTSWPPLVESWLHERGLLEATTAIPGK
jgi:acetyl esterase/lipase